MSNYESVNSKSKQENKHLIAVPSSSGDLGDNFPKKYFIFNARNIYLGPPMSYPIENHGRELIMLTLEEAKEYIEILNQTYVGEVFIYMEIAEWEKIRESDAFIKNCEEEDKNVKEIFNASEIAGSIEKVSAEMDKNINGFSLPFEADSNEDYEKKLKEKLEAFIRTIDRPAFQREGTLVDDVKSICGSIIEAFNAAKTGNMKIAEQIVEEVLEGYKEFSFAVSELDKSYAFRGIAPFDELKVKGVPESIYENMMTGEVNFFRARQVEETETLQQETDICYLPYSKRKYASDMRFSSEGKICLYLGTTSYVCSKECRWDGKKKLYLSSFKFNENGKKIKILNLVVSQAFINGRIPVAEDNIYDRNLHNEMLRVFPLMIATMFTVHTSAAKRESKYGETIKYEYLLSQVLMNVLQRAGIDGVAYLSRQGNDDFQYPQMVCLAIPVNDSNEEDEYGELVNDFVMTPPILYNEFSDEGVYEKRSYINEKYPRYSEWKTENYSAKVEFDGKEIFYEDTLFSKFDDYLINQTHNKI